MSAWSPNASWQPSMLCSSTSHDELASLHLRASNGAQGRRLKSAATVAQAKLNVGQREKKKLDLMEFYHATNASTLFRSILTPSAKRCPPLQITFFSAGMRPSGSTASFSFVCELRFSMQGLHFRGQGSGLKVQGLGFRV